MRKVRSGEKVRGWLMEMSRGERGRKREERCAKNGEAGDNRLKIIAPPHKW